MTTTKDRAALTGARILIVEDDPMLSAVIEDYLIDLGCDVVDTIPHFDTALDKARRLIIDLAVLDINLAGVASFPVAMVLRARQIPFLFMTGYSRWKMPDELRGALILAKPFRLEIMADAIREMRLTRIEPPSFGIAREQ